MVRHVLLGVAAVVTAVSLSMVVGLALGVRYANAPGVPEVLSAGLAAVFAVAGAAWQADRKDSRQARQLRVILITGLEKIQIEAKQVVTLLSDESKRYSDVDLKRMLRSILHRYESVGAFSPYQGLDNFGLIGAMADVDASCRELYALHDAERPQPVNTGIRSLAIFAASERNTKSVREHAIAVESACTAAVRVLDKW